MCGILGVVAFAAGSNVNLRAEVTRGLDAIAHRGPDGCGLWCNSEGVASVESHVILGHRRLAIIDLSDAGRQPMQSPDGKVIISYNGEIYNYIELRAELCEHWDFISACDTEVLLAAYHRWGIDMFRHLDGMFAFSIWDERLQTLVVARDPQGVKPFYYQVEPGIFRFSSEPMGLLAMRNIVRPKADWSSLRTFFQFAVSDDSSRTFFKDISQLLPGQFATVNARGEITYIGHQRLNAPDLITNSAVPASLRSVLKESVKRQLRSDVRIGFSLSGGIDSCALLGLAAELVPDGVSGFEAFTIVDPDFVDNEGPLAEQMAKKVGISHRKIDINQINLSEEIGRMVYHNGEPFTSLAMFAQYLVMRESSRAGIKVMLSGQGGDELFAGYPRVGYWHLRELVRSVRLREAYNWVDAFCKNTGFNLHEFAVAHVRYRSRTLRRCRTYLNFRPYLTPQAVDRLMSPGLNDRELFTNIADSQGDELNCSVLPRLLRYEDRNSMCFGVESRVPLLGAEVVRFALSLDPSSMISSGWTKAHLREALTGLVPDKILWETRKRGFSVPQGKMVAALRPKIEEALYHPGIDHVFRRNILLSALSDCRTANAQWIWRCVSIALWAKEYNIDFED